MMEFLIYDLKVAVLIAVFYMFYRLLLSRETFHRLNRVVLLTTAVASFLLPLCVITMHETVVVKGVMSQVSFDGLAAVIEDDPQVPLWQMILPVLYIIGMVATLAYTLVSIVKVWLLIRNSEHHAEPDGITVCVTGNDDVSPFSFGSYIVMNRSDYESSDAAIMAHERGHISLHHTLDVLLVDVLTALQWFNPAMWMLRQDLRAIHEYEADAAVLSQGINMRQYQYLLIQKAVATCGYSVANGITHSTLKNRINMMLTNKKTTSKSWLKVAALLPIVGVALALNAETVTNYVYEDTQAQPQKKVVKKGRQNGQIKMGDKTIEVKAEEATVKEEVKATIDTEAPAIIQMLNKSGKDPLVIINGKKATLEQLKALDPKSIDHINVLKDEAAKEVYGKIYEGEAENGVLVISTKDHAAAHKAKQEATAVGSFTPAPSDNDKTFDVVEQMPEFPGGASELFGFLAKTVKYPVAAQKAGQQGRVIATFVVEKDGSIGNVKVVKSVSEELDAEALRVIGAMPKWKPGMQKGQAVRVKYTIPISFRLQGNEKNEGSEKKEANEDKESSPVNVVGYGPQN
jgi:TonB family protein